MHTLVNARRGDQVAEQLFFLLLSLLLMNLASDKGEGRQTVLKNQKRCIAADELADKGIIARGRENGCNCDSELECFNVTDVFICTTSLRFDSRQERR